MLVIMGVRTRATCSCGNLQFTQSTEKNEITTTGVVNFVRSMFVSVNAILRTEYSSMSFSTAVSKKYSQPKFIPCESAARTPA